MLRILVPVSQRERERKRERERERESFIKNLGEEQMSGEGCRVWGFEWVSGSRTNARRDAETHARREMRAEGRKVRAPCR